MKRGMTFFHRDKNSATRCAYLSTRGECPFNRRTIVGQIDNLCGEKNRAIRRRGSEQFDCILRRDSARRMILPCVLHQMIGCRPIAMAIEQRADDAAIQNPLKRFVFFFWSPLCNHFPVFRKAADMQSFGIRRTTTPTGILRCVLFLKRLANHAEINEAAEPQFFCQRVEDNAFHLRIRKRWIGCSEDDAKSNRRSRSIFPLRDSNYRFIHRGHGNLDTHAIRAQCKASAAE